MRTILAIYAAALIFLFAAVIFLILNHHSTDPALYFFARDENEVDAIRFAAEVGRLDTVSLLLGGLGLILAFAFLSWMGLLRLEAKSTSREVAEKEAHDKLNRFISDEAPLVLQNYLDLLGLKEIESGAADEIARRSGDENGKRA